MAHTHSKPIFGSTTAAILAALSVFISTPATADDPPVPANPGAVAFAKLSTNLSSSDSAWYYAADPSSLGPFQEPRGLVPDNGMTSATAASPCPLDSQCLFEPLVPESSGEAWGIADLASGTLRVYASADGRVFRPDLGFYVPLVQAEAYAGFRDTLTALEDGTARFDLHIDGADVFDPRDGGTADYINFLINGAPAETVDGHGLASNDGVTGFGCGGGGDPAFTLCDVHLLVEVPVLAGDQLDLSLLLGAVAQDGTADYSHTLTLGASGVQFTSASGVFLTGAAAAVPEPGTWVMFLFGLAAGGAAMRHNRNRVWAFKN